MSNKQGAVLAYQGMQQWENIDPAFKGLAICIRGQGKEYHNMSHRKGVSKTAWFRGMGGHVELQGVGKGFVEGTLGTGPERWVGFPQEKVTSAEDMKVGID